MLLKAFVAQERCLAEFFEVQLEEGSRNYIDINPGGEAKTLTINRVTQGQSSQHIHIVLTVFLASPAEVSGLISTWDLAGVHQDCISLNVNG